MNTERDKQMKGYWAKKAQNKEKARVWTAEMENDFHDQIQKAVNDSIIYSPDYKFKDEIKEATTNIGIEDARTEDEIFNSRLCEGKIAVLNFSSYKNPGGMFINGSSAQEESLCHNSFLYNVLKEKNDFYKENSKHLNKGAYTNRAIYSPNITFFNKIELDKPDHICGCTNGTEEVITLREDIDVITCAAPNFSVARYGMLSKEENSAALDSRIEFVLKIAKENNVNNLILGAYGCGVFAQDPTEVAEIFKKHLQNYHFDKVVFAIPKSRNYDEFVKVFEDKLQEKRIDRGR